LEEAFADAAAEEDTDWWDLATAGHTLLDAAGMVPGFGEVFDLANCGWYGAEGDALNSNLSCAAAVPILGWAATGTKWGKTGFSAVEAFAKSMRANGKIPHIWATGKPSKGYSNAQNAFIHWQKHKYEFPELSSAKEYVELAHRYRDAAKLPHAPQGYRVWDRNNGNYIVYEKASNTLTAFTKDGLPMSMNRPAPRSASNPAGYDPKVYATLEDYLKAQGTER
jgi:hypothetical protein